MIDEVSFCVVKSVFRCCQVSPNVSSKSIFVKHLSGIIAPFESVFVSYTYMHKSLVSLIDIGLSLL